MSTPTYGGSAVLGICCHINHIPNANASQIAAFFGVQGVQSMDGGSRGRVFEVSGILLGQTPAGCIASEILLLSYADGQARTLVDTTGVAWPNVVFRAEYSRTDKFMLNCTLGGWLLPYRCVFHGLT